ncbi:MAG: sulfatase [Bacteroidales bacterium]|nr:sulfatase [Bacteroidales bacterium]
MTRKRILIPLLLFILVQLTYGNPNVLIIVIDDLGWKDVGYMGSKYFETPNIDQLAQQGMVFTNAYAAAANCAPSRACLLTGQNTPRHGVYTVSPSARGKAEHRKIVPTPNSNFVKDSESTLGDELKKVGYTNATFGKWHIGKDPLKQGFDKNVAGGKWGHPKSYFAPYIYPELEAPEGEYLTDRLTDEAIDFMEKNKDETFFMYMPYYTVHTPIQGKEHLIKRYKEKGGKGCQRNPKFAAMVHTMDSCVGAVLDKLKELKLEENTIVIFTSDNGGIRSISCQNPLRAGKGSYYEGGIRVPMIVRWPSNVEKGSKSDYPVVNMDIYPTLCELLGIEPGKELDGTSILPLLTQEEELEVRPLYWHFPIYLQAYNPKKDQGRDPLFRTRPGSVIRYGDWKLHEYFEDGNIELYNLKDDIGETNNLAEEQPGKAKELYQMLDEWRKELNAPVPKEKNPEYNEKVEQEAIKKAMSKN